MSHSPRERTLRRARRCALGALVPIAGLGLVAFASGARGASDELSAARIDDTKSALEQWVETRRLISKEKRDWALGKETLEERIDLVGTEIENLKERIEETEASITESDTKQAELEEKNGALKDASKALAETVAGLEERTAALLLRLPDPIRERVRPLSQRLPEKPAETELPLSQRFQNVVGILNEVNRFHREVTVTSEVRKLADGSTAQVTAMYFGLGRAYYVGADGRAAGVGTSSPEGWVWKPADEHAAAIAKAIAIVEGEDVAEFVRLPITIE